MEDIIEKIKEYKLFLALTAIGLLLGGYFLFIDLSQVHPPYRIFIRLLVQLRAKKRCRLLVPKKKRRLLQCLMHPRSLRSMSKELSNNQVSMSYAQIAESTMPFIRRVG